MVFLDYIAEKTISRTIVQEIRLCSKSKSHVKMNDKTVHLFNILNDAH